MSRRQEIVDWILLMGKSVLLVVGGILVVAGLVDLVVAGWNLRAGIVLLVGLALAVPPLAFAFRDAVAATRRGADRP